MLVCQKCNKQFPNRTFINGKEQTLHRRKYCLECNPFGERKMWRGKETVRAKLGLLCSVDGTKLVKKEFMCKVCGKRRYQKTKGIECTTCKSKRIRKERKDYAIKYLGGKCKICGYDKCRSAMVFHHKDPHDKSFNLSWNWEKSFDRIKNELDKCILLCCRCHAEMHDGLIQLSDYY